MEQIIYKNILFTSFVAMYTFGIFSFLTISPKGEEYKNYNISRRAFGVAMIMWATYVAIQWYFDLRLNNTLLATTLNFSCHYLGGMLLEFMFSALLNGYNPVQKRINEIVIETLIFNAVLFTNYLFVPSSWQRIIIIVIAVVFVIRMTFLTIRFTKTYKNTIKKADNYYSDNMYACLKWMPNSIYITIFLGFSGSILSFAFNIAIAIYMFLGLLLFTYIFISFQNYMINITKLREVILIDQITQINEQKEESVIKKPIEEENPNNSNIERKITEWIAQKGFTKQGLTIEELAFEFGSNRTYLSHYINSTYNLSFREWIAQKRIEYSKELLYSNNNLQLSKIAEMIGYSSSSFNATFIKLNNTTPSQWRSDNYNG